MIKKSNINYLILKYKHIGVIELTKEDMSDIYFWYNKLLLSFFLIEPSIGSVK